MPQDGRIKMAVRGQDVDFRVSTIPSLHGETVVLRILDRAAVAFDYARLGLSPAVIAQAGQRAGAAERDRAGHRPDRQRQDHHAVYRAAGAERGHPQDHHRRGPDRVPASGHQPDPGALADRPDLRQPAALHPPPGPRRHHGRRNPRRRDRADRGAGGADRAPGAVHAAHQLRRRRGDPAARHGGGGLPADRRPARRHGAATGAPPMPATAGRRPRPRPNWSSASASIVGPTPDRSR